jgi:hypothetical protein
MSKPALGKIDVGDTLLVIPATRSRFSDTEAIPVTVTKAARIWIELNGSVTGSNERRYPRTWRMRRDTQHDGGSGNYHNRFVTQEQYDWEQRIAAAEKYLKEIKLRPEWASPWSKPDKLLTLANLLRAHHGLDEL